MADLKLKNPPQKSYNIVLFPPSAKVIFQGCFCLFVLLFWQDTEKLALLEEDHFGIPGIWQMLD